MTPNPTTTSETETPRVDAAITGGLNPDDQYVEVDFARTIERELNKANSTLDSITKDKNYEGGVAYWIAKHDAMAVALAKSTSQLTSANALIERMATILKGCITGIHRKGCQCGIHQTLTAYENYKREGAANEH